MLSVERSSYILDQLRIDGRVTVNKLANDLGVSFMTVRRHLHHLEKAGVLKRVHGGALLLHEPPREQAFTDKSALCNVEKGLIARAALQFVHEGGSILLDAGTTTFALAALLRDTQDLIVVTSDLHIASELCSSQARLFFIGGEIERNLGRAGGVQALRFLSDIQVDVVFLGISAIGDDFTLGSYSFDNAEIKRAMLRCGAKKVLLTDRNKFGRNPFARVGPIGMVDVLITDRSFDEKEMAHFDSENVQVITTGEPTKEEQ